MERKKEREKRVRERNNIQKEENEFDFDTETVIGMTNKNNKKKQDEMKKEFAKKQRKRDKRLKRIKFFLKLILFIGVVSGIIAFATCSPIFNIQNIEVTNNKQLSPETIISLSELSIGQNIFKFWKSDVENKIKSSAYIENVELKRVFPNKLQVNIEEREPKFSDTCFRRICIYKYTGICFRNYSESIKLTNNYWNINQRRRDKSRNQTK